MGANLEICQYFIEQIIQFFLLLFTVFTISSSWLYSEGPREIRENFIHYFAYCKNKFFRKLKWLAICQLCISFWIALALQWTIIKYSGIFTYIYVALSVGGLSWCLGAITNYFLWGKCYFENKTNGQKHE